ncbi:hypothetical protein LEM8419_03405 [Neolewinella maritima]|uniref:Uncharacterized protein n=1 Tax=Neolewinella maritima TaxID=1383882 RepID=A0ABN8FB31_9BACT|nr:hypothetical protein [Neolewinella maritima]CAH1002531.1 hypothetical protein LEM8419_03405 [Neolewinella maritima]
MHPTNQPPKQQESSPKQKKEVNYRELLDRLMKSIPLLIVDEPQGYPLTAVARGTIVP